MQIYKDDQMYTPEQEAKISKLAELSRQGEMKFWDVLKVYRKWCQEQNWTDEWRAQHMRGEFEGVGMDEDL